jgi:hypothetical protein
MFYYRKSGHLFQNFLIHFVPGRPGTFAPALVPGQRDTGKRKKFCPGTKGQLDCGCNIKLSPRVYRALLFWCPWPTYLTMTVQKNKYFSFGSVCSFDLLSIGN